MYGFASTISDLARKVGEGDVGEQRRGDLAVEVSQLQRRVRRLVDVASEPVVCQGQSPQERQVCSVTEPQAEDRALFSVQFLQRFLVFTFRTLRSY